VHIKSTTYVVLKAKEKKVLRRVVNLDSEEACLMCSGSSFHYFGAATENARSPLSFGNPQEHLVS